MPLLIGSHTNIAGINCNCTFVIDSWECTGVLFFLLFFLFVSQASSAILRDVVGHPCFLVNILLDRKFYFQESLAAFFHQSSKHFKTMSHSLYHSLQHKSLFFLEEYCSYYISTKHYCFINIIIYSLWFVFFNNESNQPFDALNSDNPNPLTI